MELLSNINKIASFFFFSWLMSLYRLFSFPVRVGRQPPGAGVVVLLRRPDVGVGVHGEVDFLQVRMGPLVAWGDPAVRPPLLLLAGHFLVDRHRRLRSLVFPHLQLTGYKQSAFCRLRNGFPPPSSFSSSRF